MTCVAYVFYSYLVLFLFPLQFSFEDNLFQSMYYPLQIKFLDSVHTLCGRIPQVFLKQIERTMKKAYENRVIVNAGANFRI